MTEFVSETKTIPYGNEIVYKMLADLNNLEKVKNLIPPGMEDLTFDSDSCSFSMSPVGKVRFYIVDRESPKTIKFAVDQAPMNANMWIQLKETGERETKMRLTIKAELNPFIKPMLSKPLQEGVNRLAYILANMQYETLG